MGKHSKDKRNLSKPIWVVVSAEEKKQGKGIESEAVHMWGVWGERGCVLDTAARKGLMGT